MRKQARLGCIGRLGGRAESIGSAPAEIGWSWSCVALQASVLVGGIRTRGGVARPLWSRGCGRRGEQEREAGE